MLIVTPLLSSDKMVGRVRLKFTQKENFSCYFGLTIKVGEYIGLQIGKFFGMSRIRPLTYTFLSTKT